MIHVCYALRDESGKYSKFIGASIQSLLDNTREDITVHLFHDSTLSEENRKKFCKLVYNFEQEIVFYNVDELASEDIEKFWNIPQLKMVRHGVAMFYRFFIPRFLPKQASKAIYLDADIIVNLDIKEFWNIDLNNFPIAAIPESVSGRSPRMIALDVDPVKDGDVKAEEYFNSGVLLMDLNRLRSRGGGALSFECLDAILRHPKYKYLDQDALNYVFRKNYLQLQRKFNLRVDIERRKGNSSIIESSIIHYNHQSMNCNVSDAFNRLWFEYFFRTPFYTPETLFNLIDMSQAMYGNVIEIWRKIANTRVSQRGFYVYPAEAEKVTNFIGKNAGDIGLNAEFPNAINHLVETMEESRGNIIFFIQVNPKEYKEIRDILNDRGFEEYEDFFNVNELVLTDSNRRLVQEM
ncbi:MAG: glycosyltransferase family 8 protein [Selenomonadaceae bacterium]|nr:glycosyltransferase family 8 protein [Selenomonadaceae bacterium]